MGVLGMELRKLAPGVRRRVKEEAQPSGFGLSSFNCGLNFFKSGLEFFKFGIVSGQDALDFDHAFVEAHLELLYAFLQYSHLHLGSLT